MFKISSKNEFWWPVQIKIPRGDGTKRMDTHQIKMLFKLVSRSELAKITEKEEEDIQIAEYILDWDGVKDEEGNDVPFSREMLDQLLDNLYVMRSVSDAFQECQFGALEKN